MRPGAKRSISRIQLVIRVAGTIAIAFSFANSPHSFMARSVVMTCSVFPRPMSSAMRAPSPSIRFLMSHE